MDHSRCTGHRQTGFAVLSLEPSFLPSIRPVVTNSRVPFQGPRHPDVDTKVEVSVCSFEFRQIRNLATHPGDMSIPVMNVDTSEDLVPCLAMRQLQDAQAEGRYDFKAGKFIMTKRSLSVFCFQSRRRGNRVTGVARYTEGVPTIRVRCGC
jgi:hypothetical protein